MREGLAPLALDFAGFIQVCAMRFNRAPQILDAFARKHAPLYVSKEDLREVLRRIEARRDYEVAKESGSLLDESAPPPPVDTADIEKKYEADLLGEHGSHCAEHGDCH